MSEPVEAYNLVDFSGGLNLDRNHFKLAPNELPDMMNVDIDSRGGLSRRRGFDWFIHGSAADGWTEPSPIVDAHPWHTHPNGAGFAFTNSQGEIGVYTSTSPQGAAAGWHLIYNTDPSIKNYWRNARNSAEFKGALFLARKGGNTLELVHDQGVTSWPGMNAADFNSDLDNPTSLQFPRANVVAAWQGAMFAAGLTEDGVEHPNRVRWSHLNYPKDWHPDHYVDLGDDGGGQITAMIPDGDRLLVFRERSIHAIIGSPPEAIATYLLTSEVGCSDHRRACQTPYGAFFWDDVLGPHQLGQTRIEWVGERIYPGLASGQVVADVDCRIAWGGDRLYCRVKFHEADGTDPYASFLVYDPLLSKQGAWTRHAITHTPDEFTGQNSWFPSGYYVNLPVFFWYAPVNTEGFFLVAHGGSLLYRTRDRVTDSDVFVHPVAEVQEAELSKFGSAEAWFSTAWLDLGNPGIRKRWRRAEVIGYGLGPHAEMDMRVFTDFEDKQVAVHKIRLFEPTEGAGGDGFSAVRQPSHLHRTSTLGRHRALRLAFYDQGTHRTGEGFVTGNALPWGIDGVVLKFSQMRS